MRRPVIHHATYPKLFLKPFLTLLVCALPLCGCASPQEWVGPAGASRNQTADFEFCQQQARSATSAYPPDFIQFQNEPQNGLEQTQKRETLFKRCMKERGYHLRERE